MKRPFRAAVVSTILAGFVLCGLVPSPSVAADPYVIDAILSMTGPGSFVGHDVAQSFTALESAVNASGGIGGRPLRIVVQDDQTNPVVSVQLFNAIVAKHAALVLGPSMSATCRAVAPLAQDIVSYCISPGIHPARGTYMFSISTESTDQFLAMFRYFAQRGLTRIATITTTDATGQDADAGIENAAAKFKTVTIVDNEHFAPSDISVAAQVSRIKFSNAQLVIGWGTGTPFGTTLRSLADAGLTVPVITGSGNMSIPQLKQYAGFVPKELLFTATAALTPGPGTNRATKDAIALFDREMAKQGIPVPGWLHGIGWDPGLILVAALRKYGPNASAVKIRDFIVNLRGWTGINGAYDFPDYPQRGLGLDQVVITRWNPVTDYWDAASKGGGVPL